ncbi:MAG TPA: hypothetical protein VHV30_01740 [Polyangiaceae bacterium]|jgi:uncharacterized membrane protein|nr:hypothetical protein [Polyangiaceae bacterium]
MKRAALRPVLRGTLALAVTALQAACGGSPAAPAGGGSGASASSAAIAPASDAGTPGDAALAVENEILASCSVSAPASCPAPAPRYADVEAIFTETCVPCHAGTTASPQWPLDSYTRVNAWAPDIEAELLDCDMPPIDGGVPITAAQRTALLAWLGCGAAN